MLNILSGVVQGEEMEKIVWFRGQAWSGRHRGAREREKLLQEFLERWEGRSERGSHHSQKGENVLISAHCLSAGVNKGGG